MNDQPSTPGERLRALFRKRQTPWDRVQRNDVLKKAGVTVERFKALMDGTEQFTVDDGHALAFFYAMTVPEFTRYLSGHGTQALLVVDDSGFSTLQTVGDSIAKTRMKQGVSQVELSKRTGVTQGNISQTERSKGRPRLATVKKFAKALGVRWQSLVPKPHASHYLDEEARGLVVDEDAKLLEDLADVL